MRAFVPVIAAAIIALTVFGAMYIAAPERDLIDGSGLPAVSLLGQTIFVTVADTPALREQGLSGRDSLAWNEGMLFIFPEEGTYGFWMKDMNFSIDILWISREGRVVYMAQNVSPGTYPQVFRSESPALYVLEVPAGWTTVYNVRVGDRVDL